jgi:hypothetical protein
MRKYLPYLFAAILAFSAVAASAAHPQKPGKWQHKIEMEMPGMPMKLPPMTFERCVTEEDLKDPQKAIPSDGKSKCKIGDYKIDGNTVTWTVDCPEQQTKGSGEITFTEGSYTGWMKMTVGEQEMKTKYSGKWLGECTK